MSIKTTPSVTDDIEYLDKRKFHINVKLFLGVLGAFCFLAIASYFLHKFQLNRNSRTLRTKAEQAYDEHRLGDALKYLSQYLNFKPTDPNEYEDALVLFAEWSNERAETSGQYKQAFLSLEQALRVKGDRHDLRRKAARMALKLGRYGDALTHLELLCPTPSRPISDANSPTLESDDCGGDGELVKLKAQAYTGKGEYAQAARGYINAIRLAPDDFANYVDLVLLIEKQGNKVDLNGVQNAFSRLGEVASTASGDSDLQQKVGELVLKAMVLDSSESARPRAYLARAAYFQVHGMLDRAAADIEESLKIGDDPSDALLLGAEIELARAEADQFSDAEDAQARVSEHRAAALAYARRGSENASGDLRFHLILSRLETDEGNLSEAERLLREGLQILKDERNPKADPASQRRRYDLEVQLIWSLGNLLITRAFDAEPGQERDNLLAEVEQNVKALGKLGARREWTVFLGARIDVGRQNWHAAAEKLEQVRLSPGNVNAAHIADLALADCYYRMWNPDLRLRVFRRAVEEDPTWVPGRLGLAESLRDLEKIDEAIVEYGRLTNIPSVWPDLVRLLIRKQLSLEITVRDWGVVKRAIDNAEHKMGSDAVQPVLLRAEYLFQTAFEAYHAKPGTANFDAGETLLRDELDKRSDEPLFWTALANYILRRSDRDSALRNEQASLLLDQATQRLGDRIEFRLLRVRLVQQLGADAGAEQLAQLESSADALAPPERARVAQALAQSYADLGMFAKSVGCWRRAIADSPDSVQLNIALSDAAGRVPDPAAIQEALEAISRIEGGQAGNQGPNRNFAEANAFLMQVFTRGKSTAASDGEQRELENVCAELKQAARQRPTWSMIYRDLGYAYDLLGNAVAAGENFQKARKYGDNSRSTIIRVVSDLLREGKEDLAQQELLKVENSSPELLTGELARLAFDAAWKHQQFAAAERLAPKLDPNSGGYQDILYQAQLKLLRDKDDPDADALLQKAVDQFPESALVWLVRLEYLLQMQRVDDAKALVEQAARRIPDQPRQLRPMTLAMCYERLDDKREAQEQYSAATKAAPEAVEVGVQYVTFLVRNEQRDEADREVDRLLKLATIDPEQTEQLRTVKALIQSERGGGYEDLTKALKMLNEGHPDDNGKVPLVNLRAQARILARSNLRSDQLKLIRVLETIGDRKELQLPEKLQLARLYEATAQFPQAIAAFRKLKDEDPKNPVFLVDFALGSLNQKTIPQQLHDEVADAVAQLRHVEPNSLRTAVTRARLKFVEEKPAEAVSILESFLNEVPRSAPENVARDLVKQQKPGEAVEALRSLFPKQNDADFRRLADGVQKLLGDGNEAEALAVLRRFFEATDYVDAIQAEVNRTVAAFFETNGEFEAAERAYRSYVSRSKQPEAGLVLAAFLARRERIDEALDLCEAAAATCRPQAVAQVSVGVIRAGRAQAGQVKRVEERLLAALGQAEGPAATALSISLADLRDYQERYADAAAIYRRLIESDERNIVALNNLAWLTSFLQGERDGSLSLIDRAIRLRGPLPDLLDTRAVVRLNLGRPREAIKDLERALSEAPNASMYMHLALAYLKVEDKDQAADSFAKAEQAGLDPKTLHSFERVGYEELLKKLPRDNRRAQR